MYKINDLKKIYKNKKVLITGHTGFKGAYMCLLLKLLGAKVYGFALKEDKESLYKILKYETSVKKSMFLKSVIDKEKIADIRKYDILYSFVKEIMPDYILHMAAQPLVLKGYKEPKYTYEVNFLGTLNLLETVRLLYTNKKVSVLNVTTDKVYKNDDAKNFLFKENYKLCGFDPYANSKSCSELVTYSYDVSYFKNKKNVCISTARAGNVIGGGDMSENRIIPDAVRSIKNKKNLVLRNPNSIRPYQFVLEPLIMYLNIMAYQVNNKKYEGNYNIGPDRKNIIETKTLVEWFFDEYKNIDGVERKAVYKKQKGAVKEAKYLMLDNSLIKKVFGYKEIFNMQLTMKETAEIYYRILNKENVIDYICNLINNI